ncbi:MAG: hypothetical protein AAFP03_14100 [Cyanobacteria bacterium J06598_3]
MSISKRYLLIFPFLLLGLVACSPSAEDQSTAAQGCNLAKNYLEWQNATTPEQKSLQLEMISNGLENLRAVQSGRDPDKVRKLMDTRCPDRVETFEQLMAGELTLDENLDEK